MNARCTKCGGEFSSLATFSRRPHPTLGAVDLVQDGEALCRQCVRERAKDAGCTVLSLRDAEREAERRERGR